MLDMPAWGEQFQYVGDGWHSFPRRKLAKDRIAALTGHIESMQLESLPNSDRIEE